MLIVLGLYGVLWGKKKETSSIHDVEEEKKPTTIADFDLESVSPKPAYK